MPSDTSPARASEVYPKPAFSEMLRAVRAHKWLRAKVFETESLLNLCQNSDEVELTFDLLTKFKYITNKKLSKLLRKAAKKIVSDWDLSSKDTALVCKHSSAGFVDSSNYILAKIRKYLPDDWYGRNFRTDLASCLADHTIKNIVLVDDFSGTGDSLQKHLDFCNKTTPTDRRDVSLYACFLCAMEETQNRNYRFLKELYCAKLLKPGISGYNIPAVAQQKISIMKGIESRLKVKNSYSCGYKSSETLYALDDSPIPNNTFPIFWEHHKDRSSGHIPLFRRVRK